MLSKILPWDSTIFAQHSDRCPFLPLCLTLLPLVWSSMFPAASPHHFPPRMLHPGWKETRLCRNTSQLNSPPCTIPSKQISHWEPWWDMGRGSSPWPHNQGRAAHPVPSVPPGTQNECPLYGTHPCRFDMVFTHQPPALCRKCHFDDTHPCRSVSSQGNKSSKQKNARALGSQARSCSLLSHSQAAAIPDIPRLPTSMQRRFPIKSTGPWDHCQTFFLWLQQTRALFPSWKPHLRAHGPPIQGSHICLPWQSAGCGFSDVFIPNNLSL